MQDWGTGEVLTLAYMNEEALRLTRETGRDPLLQPLARRALAQGRDLRQRAARAAAPLRLRRRRARRARRAGRAGVPHRSSARASTATWTEAPIRRPTRRRPRASRAPAAHEALATLERTLLERRATGPRAPTRSSCSTTRRGSATRCARRPTRSARAAAAESDERLAEEAADVLYHLQVLLLSRGVPIGGGAGDAQWPSPLSQRSTSDPSLERARELARERQRDPGRLSFVDDCETPVSAFLKLRDGGPCFLLESAEQGRLGRYSFLGFRPRAMLRWADGSSSEWRGRARLGRGAGRQRGRRPVRRRRASTWRATGCRRSTTCRRSRAGRSGSSATTWSGRSSRSASPTRTRSGSPTWR